jgi:hypothetical protein
VHQVLCIACGGEQIGLHIMLIAYLWRENIGLRYHRAAMPVAGEQIGLHIMLISRKA